MGLETIDLYEIIIGDLFSLLQMMQSNNNGSKQLSASKKQPVAIASCQAEKFRSATPQGLEVAAGSSLS
jgi:hypothetical protein